MNNPTFSLALTYAELRRLADCLDSRAEALPLENGVFETQRDEQEHDMLSLRLHKALDRVTKKARRTKSERVHLPKVEALLNELL